VFPHFRDLAQQQASLKDYFADEQVQAYLPANAGRSSHEWVWCHQSLTHAQRLARQSSDFSVPIQFSVRTWARIRQGVGKPTYDTAAVDGVPLHHKLLRQHCYSRWCKHAQAIATPALAKPTTSPDATDLNQIQILRDGQEKKSACPQMGVLMVKHHPIDRVVARLGL